MKVARSFGPPEARVDPNSVDDTALMQEGGDPPSEFYYALHRIADRLEPELRRKFLGAIDRLDVDQAALLAALRRKRPEAVVQALTAGGVGQALSVSGVQEVIRQNVLAAAEASTEELAELGVELSLDMTNPKAVQAARQQAGRLITEIDDESRQAVRKYVKVAFADGVPPQRLARQVRGVVGLTSRQAQWATNMRRDMEALVTATEGDVDDLLDDITSRRLDAATMQRIRSRALRGDITPQFVDEVVERYEESLLNFRAQNISRTETIRASNRGQQALWRTAREEGLLDTERATRRWIVTPDDRLCFICAPMAGQQRPMEEPFMSPFNGAKAMVPPIHPMCRCAVGLTFDDGG